jgi:hypothetical protein
MEPTTQHESGKKGKYYPLKTGKERSEAWKAIRGMWKDRQPDPVAWHKASRKEWDRDLPELKS